MAPPWPPSRTPVHHDRRPGFHDSSSSMGSTQSPSSRSGPRTSMGHGGCGDGHRRGMPLLPPECHSALVPARLNPATCPSSSSFTSPPCGFRLDEYAETWWRQRLSMMAGWPRVRGVRSASIRARASRSNRLAAARSASTKRQCVAPVERQHPNGTLYGPHTPTTSSQRPL